MTKQMQSMSVARMLAVIDFQHSLPRERRLAETICGAAFGDWRASGYEVRLSCVRAAQAALLCLDQHGFDLTMLDGDEL